MAWSMSTAGEQAAQNRPAVHDAAAGRIGGRRHALRGGLVSTSRTTRSAEKSGSPSPPHADEEWQHSRPVMIMSWRGTSFSAKPSLHSESPYGMPDPCGSEESGRIGRRISLAGHQHGDIAGRRQRLSHQGPDQQQRVHHHGERHVIERAGTRHLFSEAVMIDGERNKNRTRRWLPMVDQAFRSGVDLDHGPSLTGTHFSPTCGDAYAQRKRERDRMFEVLLPLVPGTVLGAWTLVERCAEVSGRSAPWR